MEMPVKKELSKALFRTNFVDIFLHSQILSVTDPHFRLKFEEKAAGDPCRAKY